MGLHQATCDKCGEKIKPEDQYGIMKNGQIRCLTCAETNPNQVLAFRFATLTPEEEEAKEEKKKGKK